MKTYSFILMSAVFITGMILSYLIFEDHYEKETRDIQLMLENDVEEMSSSLEKEIRMNFEVVSGLNGLFNSSDHVSTDEFSDYCEAILVRHETIQALEWIPKVSHENRARFTYGMRAEHPGFTIKERLPSGSMAEAGIREFYYPVTYLEPVKGNEPSFGFDLGSDPDRFETMKKSRDTGQMLITRSLDLVQSPGRGYRVFIPLYNRTPDSTEERRSSHKGFVSGVFRIPVIFEKVLRLGRFDNINLYLIDETESEGDGLLHKRIVDEDRSTDKVIKHRVIIRDIGGRNWSLIGAATEDYVSEVRTLYPYVIFLSGLLFNLFILAVLVINYRYSSLIEQKVKERTEQLQHANRKLELLSYTDGLTGVSNRRFFDSILKKEWSRALRDRTHIGLIIVDIDYYKAYNDIYGHQKGDEVLVQVSGLLRGICKRPADVVARYGGEEFVILLPNTEEINTPAENCRKAVEDMNIPHAASTVSKYLTISAGAVSLIPDKGSSPGELVNMADNALYKAKVNGRNRVVTV